MHFMNFENNEHKLEEKDLNLFELQLESCKTHFPYYKNMVFSLVAS
jgi:hypothetical protein